MPNTITLDIPVDQSPIPAALDMLYDFIQTNITVGAGERLAILGSAVEFDITKDSRLYNDYVVKAFTDRTVLVSPIITQGLGDKADRYSTRFVEMLRLIISQMDLGLSPSQQAQVDADQAAIDAISQDMDDFVDKVEDAWSIEMQHLGIDVTKIDTDPVVRDRYYLERTRFLTRKRYAQKMYGKSGFHTRIRDREISIEATRLQAFPDDDSRLIYDLYSYALDELVVRPKRPELELKYHWDEFTIQNPENFGMGAVFDISPGVSSIVDPRTILKGKGAKGFSVNTKHKETHAHDSAWGVSGSGSYMPFVRGHFSASNTSHFRSSIKRVREIDIHFEHFAELQITRDSWFASDVFDAKVVQKYCKKHPVFASKMKLLVNSLVIGRGLTLTLHFDDLKDVHEWGSSSVSGGGGVDICGYSFGADGSSSSSYDDHIIDTAKQTVTFKDGPNVCRLLGVKVAELSLPFQAEQALLTARPIYDVPAALEAAKALVAAGKLADRNAILAELRNRATEV